MVGAVGVTPKLDARICMARLLRQLVGLYLFKNNNFVWYKRYKEYIIKYINSSLQYCSTFGVLPLLSTKRKTQYCLFVVYPCKI